MKIISRYALIIILGPLLAATVALATAVAAPADPESRLATIERQRAEKNARLTPAAPDKVESALEKYIGDDPMNKYAGGLPGLRLRFGGLPSGGGLALGLEYKRPDLADGLLSFRASAVGSNNLWYGVESELALPRLGGRFLELSLLGGRTYARSMTYYGSGENSALSGHTNYRRTENSISARLTAHPTRRYFSLGFEAGWRQIGVGRGDCDPDTDYDDDYDAGYDAADAYADDDACVSDKFSPWEAPGLGRDPWYLRLGSFIEVDSRDKPGDPHAGTHFLARLERMDDRKYDRYSFKRIDATLEQYIPFLNEKRVIALRAASSLSYAANGQVVPFFMQPTLGGSSDLRGYSRYRFYDDNLFLLGAEYRWELFTLMDAALFVDSGKVFHRDRDFNLRDMEMDGGFGFRFKTRDAVVFRVDTAFSQEGYGLWFAFSHVF